MTTENFGYDVIKDITFAGMRLAKEISVAFEDKKLSLTEGLGFLDNLMEIPGLIERAPQLKEQLKDFSLEEKTKLVGEFSAEFDIPNDEAEQKFEAAFDLGASAVRGIYVFRQKPAA